MAEAAQEQASSGLRRPRRPGFLKSILPFLDSFLSQIFAPQFGPQAMDEN